MGRFRRVVSRAPDPFHPAILQAIDQMVRITEELDKGLCICGEMASDPIAFALLVGLGLREFSVSAPSILPLKAMLRKLSFIKLSDLAREALNQDQGEKTRALVVKALQCPD